MDPSYNNNNNAPGQEIFIRVNGEILESILKNNYIASPENQIPKGMVLGSFTSFDDNQIATVNIDEKDVKFSIKNLKTLPTLNENIYQICFVFNTDPTKDIAGSVLSLFDFGSKENFDNYSYSTTYFSYWSILKERYSQLSLPTDEDQMAVQ